MDPRAEIIGKAAKLVEPYCAAHGIELVEVMYRREQAGMVLRLLVDTAPGITMGECEELNKHMGELLDREDIIGEHFTLEVSSPGLDRPIKTDRDFERSIGKELDITTYVPIDGRKTHAGRLAGIDKENVVMEASGVSTVIPRAKIARAVLKVEFN